MNSFKSCHYIDHKPHITRKSRRVSKQRVSKEHEILIPNPFRHPDQENYLPSDLQSQVQQPEYISPHQIQAIQFTSAVGARRSSVFARHLQAMQNAAKKQEEMYHFFMDLKPSKQEGSQTEIMQAQQPMTIEEDENLSTRMNHCFFMMDDDPMGPEQLNFFQPQDPEEEIIFYSQNQIQSQEMGDDYEAYFDV